MDTNQPVDIVEEEHVSSPPRKQPRQRWGRRLATLLSDSTFASRFLHPSLRRPLIGYLVAIFLQTAAAIGIMLLLTTFPTFRFPEAPLILVILLVALGWGTGPGILATLLGAILFMFLIIPPTFSFEILYIEDAIGLFLYILAGLAISTLTGQTQAAMHQAERDASARAIQFERLENEAKTRARELEALFNAITDGIMVYDATGHIRQINTTAREQLSRYLHPDTFNISAYERAEMVKPRSGEGDLFPVQKIPVLRMLQGEIITGADAQDVHIQTFKGEDLWLNMSGTPLFDEDGQVTGAISIARDVTERRRLEERTHTALEALLEMAQVIVQGAEQEEANPLDMETYFLQLMQRLARLTQEVLGCHRLGFTQVMPETELLQPLAVVGLPPEQEAQWWREQKAREVHLSEGADPELLRRLRANEILLMDLTQPPYNAQPNPYSVRQMLAAPMMLGTHLLGFLTLDYGGLDHTYTPEELALTKAVTKLAALAMERDRLQAEATLARANELAAKEANRLKDEFIGIASHELRTPMTTMKANLQLAERQLRRYQTRYEGEINQAFGQILGFVERTERQLERQNRLIRDLLDVSRIESGHLELQLETCDLLTLLQEAVEDQREITPSRTIQLDLLAEETVLVTADRDRVAQVISNYLSNALKYSEADQPVLVQLKIRGIEACVSVQDHGPGLLLAEQQHIWNRFYRVPGVVVKSGSGVGLGLGLHISRTIIERQGGHVGVESEPDHGSTFWFTLPLVTN